METLSAAEEKLREKGILANFNITIIICITLEEFWTGRSGRLGCWRGDWQGRGWWGGAGPSGGRRRWSSGLPPGPQPYSWWCPAGWCKGGDGEGWYEEDWCEDENSFQMILMMVQMATYRLKWGLFFTSRMLIRLLALRGSLGSWKILIKRWIFNRIRLDGKKSNLDYLLRWER